MLNAVGLPELVTATQEHYEARAIELATQPNLLAQLRKKLLDNRLQTPLFDTIRSVRHLERAYVAMFERFQAELPPADIAVRGRFIAGAGSTAAIAPLRRRHSHWLQLRGLLRARATPAAHQDRSRRSMTDANIAPINHRFPVVRQAGTIRS